MKKHRSKSNKRRKKLRKEDASHQRRPRMDVLALDFGRDQTITGMHVDEGSRVPTLRGAQGEVIQPARVSTGSAYRRLGKSPKSLVQLPSDPGRIILDADRALCGT